VQVEVEQKSKLATAEARLKLAKLQGDSLRAGLSAADLRLLEIEQRQTELDWLDAREEMERQRRMHERGFIADAVLERYVRRAATARAALEEKQLQIELRRQGARAEDLLENERTIERYTADLARGASAMQRRLGQIDAGIAVGTLQLEQRRFDRDRNAGDLQQTTTLAATSGVLRVRMYSNWRQGGVWQPYAAGIRKNKYDTVADIIGRGSFRVDLMVHESDLHRVSVDAPVRIHVGAFPGKVFRGRVKAVGGVGRDRQDVAPRGYEDSPSGVTMFNVEVRFDEVGDADLHPGMSAIAEIVVSPVARRLLIPSAAVGQHQGASAVRIAPARSRGKPSVRRVAGHPFDALNFVVEDGLAEGDTILARWTP
jgi:multidrug resistance efflux pump